MTPGQIAREVWVKSQPSSLEGVFSDVLTDKGFACSSVEKPWLNNLPDVSCIPRPLRRPCLWQFSEKHGCYLYHIQDVPGRTVVEIHSANVHLQLLGCLALGSRVTIFEAGSIHSDPIMPPVAMRGVMASAATLSAFHKDLQDEDGCQLPFWVNLDWDHA